jgi:hypothetical protein
LCFDARFHVIHLKSIHAVAVVSRSKSVLGASVAALGGFASPGQRGGVVPGHALAAGQHPRKIELGQSVILVGRFPVPAHGLLKVLRGSALPAPLQPESELRLGVSLLGRCLDRLQV